MDLLPYERSTAALAPGRATCTAGSQQLLEPAAAGRARPGRGRRGHPARCTRSGPGRAPPAPAGRRRARSAPRRRSTRCCWPRRSRRCSTSSRDGLAAEVDARRRPGERALAHRVPVLAGGDDLRRQRRDPAQHHRPPAPRPREPTDDGRATTSSCSSAACARPPRRTPATALDAALAELGWHDALADDPQAAVSMLFELQGEANAHVVGARPRARPRRWACEPDRRRGAAAGRRLGGARPDGWTTAAGPRWTGSATAALGRADAVLVVARNGDRTSPSSRSPAISTRRPVGGVDPWLGLVQVTGETRRRRGVSGRSTGPARSRSASSRSATSWSARRGRCSALAREHALERIQFGQPIARFQAVRHRLAETLVAIETADAMLAAAWEDESPGSAAMAKALAGRGARTASQALPAGARRHRLHHRAPAAPLRAGACSCSTSCSARPAPSPARLGADLLASPAAPRDAPPLTHPNPFLRRIGC